MIALLLLGAACTLCEELQACGDCTRNDCVWIEYEDGEAHCDDDAEDVPPADAAKVESEADCPRGDSGG